MFQKSNYTWYNHGNQGDWKIAGLRTATFSGTPGNWGASIIQVIGK